MSESVLETAPPAKAGRTTVSHPLESLTPAEIRTASRLARAEMAELGDTLRFEIIELKEPAKATVRAFRLGDSIEREARDAGAKAAKVCGAGGGGCIAFLAEPGRTDQVRGAIERAGGQSLPLRIARRGLGYRVGA